MLAQTLRFSHSLEFRITSEARASQTGVHSTNRHHICASSLSPGWLAGWLAGWLETLATRSLGLPMLVRTNDDNLSMTD
jgi:hypothetical protein